MPAHLTHFFKRQMRFLMPNQQCQRTEVILAYVTINVISLLALFLVTYYFHYAQLLPLHTSQQPD